MHASPPASTVCRVQGGSSATLGAGDAFSVSWSAPVPASFPDYLWMVLNAARDFGLMPDLLDTQSAQAIAYTPGEGVEVIRTT